MVITTFDLGKWTDDLSVEVEVIDKDHKKLFTLLSQLRKINETRENISDAAVEKLLSELYAYTEYHFSREELLMKACAYPHVENHHRVHEMIRTHIKFHMDAFHHDPSSINLELLHSFVENWLIDHIGGMDKNYSSYMKDKKDLVDNTNSLFETTRRKRGADDIHTLSTSASEQKLKHGTTTNDSPLTEQELREAIDKQQIFPYFQPKVRIDTGKPVGFKALARWQHPEKGIILPGEFIPLFEKYDLIDGLTSLMMDTTFAQTSSWIKAGLQLKISINISALAMKSLDFPGQLLVKTNAYDLDASIVTLEVAESAMSDELADSLDILARIRMKGFLLSIHVYGTGYSSMMRLNRAPFNELKIDQSFIKDMDVNEESRDICESFIDLAHKLNMTVTAEGIETKAIWNILKEIYCTEGQGYYFGKPMPANKFEAWYLV